jgi:hypothetical protein
LPCFYYFFLATVVIRYETTATARWALLFIVRTFFDDTITVAVWTGFHCPTYARLLGPDRTNEDTDQKQGGQGCDRYFAHESLL